MQVLKRKPARLPVALSGFHPRPRGLMSRIIALDKLGESRNDEAEPFESAHVYMSLAGILEVSNHYRGVLAESQ